MHKHRYLGQTCSKIAFENPGKLTYWTFSEKGRGGTIPEDRKYRAFSAYRQNSCQYTRGSIVSRTNWFAFALVFCTSLSADWKDSVFANDQVTPEQIVAAHIISIGSPEALAELKTLAFVGRTSVDFIQGVYGNMTGTSMLVSDGKKLGIVLKYGDINYRGEYFAFDEKDVSVGYIDPLQRSPLADFIFRYNGIMKEGLLGGVLSRAWPLLNLQQHPASLKCRKTTIDGRPLHEIEYRPKKSLREVKIKLYFDLQTYRHVRTEYRIRIRDDMSVGRGGGGGFDVLHQGLPDSIYVLVENFDDFKRVGAMTLPHSYTIYFSVEGQGHTFIGKWTLTAKQWAFNRTYDDRIFVAQK
jgi:hypothetical protein